MESVLAVIPSFRPDPASVQTLIDALRSQGIPVVVSDDGSPATFDADLRSIIAGGVAVIRHRSNLGIARGLNDGIRIARERGAEWLLTMDQDSIAPPHLVVDLLSTAERDPRIGVVGVETIGDVGGDVGYPIRNIGGLLVTEEVFQSGSLWSVAALDEIGGFDESLGIDGVDAAACLRLRECGRLVAVAPGTRIGHRYGEGRQVSLFGRTVVSTGHSPNRRESMVRNRLALGPAEFRQSPRHAFRTLRRLAVNTLLGATIETGRWENTKSSIRGLLPKRSR